MAMRRCEPIRPSPPRPPTPVPPPRSWSGGAVLAGVFGLALALGLAAPAKGQVGALPEGLVTEIRFEGNETIPDDKIRERLLSRAGRPLDQRTVEADLKALFATRWFSDVKPFYAPDPDGQGFILIFSVQEMPVLSHVEYRGRKAIRLKELEDATGLKVGARADAMLAKLAVKRVEQLYREKGYELVEVALLEGGRDGDTRVVIRIFEGPKFRVRRVSFAGNTFVSDAMLRTKVGTKRQLLGLLPGRYHQDDLEEDTRKLIDYYQSLGFFEVQVTPVTSHNPALGEVGIEFVISEGTRYHVRDLHFEGNEKLSDEALREGLALHSNRPFEDRLHEADRRALETKYGAIGCIDAEILPEPRYTDEPGVVDLVYRIHEGDQYLMAELIIRGNDRTKDKVIRREAIEAGLLPGEPLDANRIEDFRKRLALTGYFITTPELGKPIDIQIIDRRPPNMPYGGRGLPDLNEVIRAGMREAGLDGSVVHARMQNLELDMDLAPLPPLEELPPLELDAAPAPAPAPGPALESLPPLQPLPSDGAGGFVPFGSVGPFDPPVDVPPAMIGPPGPGGLPPLGATPPPRDLLTSPLGSGEPPGTFPNLPGTNMSNVGPDLTDPFPNRSYADILASVDEAPTGRFMFGIGANSFGGLFGNIVVHERNFDLFNIPRSWRDFTAGTAFRGAGQVFHFEGMAGTLINRLRVSFTEPYLFDLPIALNTQGYFHNRLYPEWTETRGGGRFSLGRTFGTLTYADFAVRAEDVHFFGFQSPAPAEYLAVSGHTTLVTLRPTIRFDDRNDPFVPFKGRYLEFAYEHGFGTFTFPKLTVEGRQHIPVWSRPDGTGNHFVTLRGFYGVTGPDTPMYEQFFLGDFRTLRGFAYRQVGPRVLDRIVGGLMVAVGSVEYQFPWTANDQLQQVVFTDFGTVENSYNFTTFRMSVGTGLRVLIPALGPLPLAFDLGFPVVREPGDRTLIFNFNIGAFY